MSIEPHLVYLQSLIDDEVWKSNDYLLRWIYARFIKVKYEEEEGRNREDMQTAMKMFGSQQFWTAVNEKVCNAKHLNL